MEDEMRVQNPAMAGGRLLLKSGKEVTCDADGVVDVSDKDGRFLCSTPGWELEGKKKKGVKPPETAAAAAKPPPAPTLPPAPEEPAAAEPEPEAEAEEEGPDLESMTKAQLIDTAAEYDVEVDPRDTKAEILAQLDKAIYGDN
jgi:hypothetical protein